MHSSEPTRRGQHRRHPELILNTNTSTNTASTAATASFMSPTGAAAHLPSIPIPTRRESQPLAHKSSQRDIAPTTPPATRRPPPVSSRAKQAAANRAANAKLSVQALRDRDIRDAHFGVRERDRDRDMDSYLDGLSALGPAADVSNKENDLPSTVTDDRDPSRDRDSSQFRNNGNGNGNGNTYQPRPRDSHDLSLSPRNVTRDSLVTNMLLSLDQFSMGQMNSGLYGGGLRTMTGYGDSYNARDDDRALATRAMTMTNVSRSRGGGLNGGHGYSYSSDYDGRDDSSRASSNPSRGRRSNSSSTGFQSNLGRISSMREMSNQRSVPGTPGTRPLHSRGGRGSKSSSTNSIDATGYAQALGGSQRWVHGLGARSPTVDVARRQSFGAQPDQQQQSQPRQPWHIELSNTFFSSNQNNADEDDYDAAPTPTVPAGPRRLPTMPSMPSFPRPEPMAEPLSPVRSINLERKRSNKSSRSAAGSTRQAQPKFAPRDAPPIPIATVELDSAPAPNVGYGKAKEPVHPSAPNHQAVSQPKERPGFFKRMFGGGSKNSIVAALDMSANATFKSTASLTSTSAAMGPNSSKPASNPPSRDSHHSSHGHGLQKKPSSFFRRRKKSVTEAEPPPPVPAILPAPVISPVELQPAPPKRSEVLAPRSQPSPVTSLRAAMDPFLKGSRASSGQATPVPLPDDNTSPAVRAEDNEYLLAPTSEQRNARGFSPEYEPDPKATIRSVPSDKRMREERSPAREPEHIATPSRESPELPHMLTARSGSFLHDNSDSEDSPKQVANKRPSQSAMTDGRRPRSPNDVSRSGLVPQSNDQALSSPSSSTTIRDRKLDRLTDQAKLADDKGDRPSSLTLPIEGAVRGPNLTPRKSAASIPSVKVDDAEQPSSKISTPRLDTPLDEPDFVLGDPTEDDRVKAQRIFDGNEDFIQKEKAAAWMGEEGPVRQRTLRAYMELFNFTGKSIVASLRDVCNRLVFRAETQQVDRILVAFSRRWCDCNPNHGFRATDVIHTICYSIMLLNTDLHLADIESKMTRSQFIKNTMTTIRQALADSAPEVFERPSILPGRGSNLGEDSQTSVEHERSSFRNSFVKLPIRAGSAMGDAPTELDDCGPLVKAPFDGALRAWESQMEIVLKDTYASIRDERLPLYGATEPVPEHPSGALSVIGMLKRTPSVLSKAPSENPSIRGRVIEGSRAGNSRWASKSRSRPRGFGGTGFSSSRTSFDDGQSLWSPVESSATWSRGSLGRTQTSMSMDSFGSHFPRGEYQQSIGFANALSQAIIREDPLGSVPSLLSDEFKATQLLEDESLELAGPPWVKEGIVIHKHHLDGIDRKAKDRNWTEVFAVVQKGSMSIFSFSPNKSISRAKGRAARNAQNLKKGAVVGGGNWQENATTLGSWSLRQTLASALPSPGYSKQRPHVWALSLPTGAVHLFQVGTPEISKEFVTTANYWSARLSTHPLVGGISNIEYGWSDAIINNALVSAINETTGSTAAGTGGITNGTGRQRSNSRPGSSAAVGRASMHSRGSSFRSVGSFDFGSGGPRAEKLPGDKITIAEWAPPTQSMRPSNAPEKEQLETLLGYVRGIEEELQQHNALRSPMLLAFSPRGHNAAKAMANWERKSAYLLREIVKFRTYVDCLQHAEQRKQEIWRDREVARRAARGESFEAERDGEEESGVGGGEPSSSAGGGGLDLTGLSSPRGPSAAGLGLSPFENGGGIREEEDGAGDLTLRP